MRSRSRRSSSSSDGAGGCHTPPTVPDALAKRLKELEQAGGLPVADPRRMVEAPAEQRPSTAERTAQTYYDHWQEAVARNRELEEVNADLQREVTPWKRAFYREPVTESPEKTERGPERAA